MKQIYNKRKIEGVSTVGIIRNGGYHVFEMPVYEDGSFDCWHRIDFTGLRKDLERRWLVYSLNFSFVVDLFHSFSPLFCLSKLSSPFRTRLNSSRTSIKAKPNKLIPFQCSG